MKRLFLLTSIAAMIIVIGCQAFSKQEYTVEKEVRDPDTNQVVYKKRVTHNAKAQAPDMASMPTTQSVGETGGETSIAPEQEKPLAAYIGEKREAVVWGGAVVLLILAGVAYWATRSLFVAGSFAVSAGILAALPKLVDIAGPPVAWALAVTLIAGLAYGVALLIKNRKENLSGIKSWLKLTKEGKPDEAGAALREAPLVRDLGGTG